MADHGTLTLDDAERAALAENFVAVTASTTEAALFFLESHNWNLDSALHSFFDADEDVIAAPPAAQPLQPESPVLPTDPVLPPVSAAVGGRGAAAGGRGAAGAAAGGSRAGKKASGSGRSGIRTLADLSNAGSDSEDDDEDEPAEYYTGGEKSGMLVQDPSKGNNNVDAIFDRAREMGAMDGPVDPHSSSSSRSFTGTGRLLSGESVTPAAPQPPADVIHTISFWTNGFTVNDGPLRRFDDPENAPFLESIGKSECPKELEPADRRTMVNVNLVRKDQKYTEPVKPRTAFQGVGRTLAGGSTSATIQPTVTTTATTRAPAPAMGLSVDASLPSTSLQLRLADGTRMVARFNTHHTVADIRAFIDASRPGASRTYQLQTVGFPPKPIADLTQTIEQAGLANSVIVQRL